MFDGLRDRLFLKKIGKKFKKSLRKMYSRQMTKYNIKIVKMIYKNLAKRYGTTVKYVYNCLPLTIQIDKEMEGAYGLCQAGPVVIKKLFRKPRTVRKATIFLNGNDVTATTFIHEFGHYLRFLIAQVAMKRNKKAMDDFKNIVDLVRSRADAYSNADDNFFVRGSFTVDEEENFAKSWEQYMKDGISPDKKHKKIFNTFRKAIFNDMHKRNERRKYEFYEDLEVKITPERKKFFDELIIGKKLKKDSLIIRLLEIYIYVAIVLIIAQLISKYIFHMSLI